MDRRERFLTRGKRFEEQEKRRQRQRDDAAAAAPDMEQQFQSDHAGLLDPMDIWNPLHIFALARQQREKDAHNEWRARTNRAAELEQAREKWAEWQPAAAPVGADGGAQQQQQQPTERKWVLKQCPASCPLRFDAIIVDRDGNACNGNIRVGNAVLRDGPGARPQAMQRQ